MITESKLKLFAHLATVDDDFEWYEFGYGFCHKCGLDEPFLADLYKYPIDHQPLLLLVRRFGPESLLPWMVSIGPVGTPWCDRFFGRPIRTRIVIECEDYEMALKLFAWGLMDWWDRREELPSNGASLNDLHRAQQPSAIANWLLEGPIIKMRSFDLLLETFPHTGSVTAPITSGMEPKLGRYSEIAKEEFMVWVSQAGHVMESRMREMDQMADVKQGTQYIAAVSQGIMPRYHHRTLWAIGMEHVFPTDWTVHEEHCQSAKRSACLHREECLGGYARNASGESRQRWAARGVPKFAKSIVDLVRRSVTRKSLEGICDRIQYFKNRCRTR